MKQIRWSVLKFDIFFNDFKRNITLPVKIYLRFSLSLNLNYRTSSSCFCIYCCRESSKIRVMFFRFMMTFMSMKTVVTDSECQGKSITASIGEWEQHMRGACFTTTLGAINKGERDPKQTWEKWVHMGAGGMDRDESRSKPPALTRSTDPVQDQNLVNREVYVLPLLAVPLYYEGVSYISISSF